MEEPSGEFHHPARCCAARRGCRGTRACAGEPVLATTRRLFGWAVAQGLLENNPCDQVERPTSERARERVLTTGELRALWQAFDSLDPFWAALFRLCLLTGQRVGEVLSMRWSDIDGDWWTVPYAKNGLSHRVPLSPRALQVLLETPRRGEHRSEERR